MAAEAGRVSSTTRSTAQRSGRAIASVVPRPEGRKGQLDAKDATDALGRIRPADSLEALSAADLVIEAIPEDLALKRDAFRRLDATAADGAILATNTSSLSVAAIGSSVTPAGSGRCTSSTRFR